MDTPTEPSSSDDFLLEDVMATLAIKMGQVSSIATPAPRRASSRSPRKVKQIRIDYEDQPTTTHDMAGGDGYSLASNWFTSKLAQLIIANRITRSQVAVFLYVASGQKRGTGVASFTQQEITDALNEEVSKQPGGKPITRPTVNRAVKSLCEYGWLETAGYGRIQLNVRLWFSGNSDAQRDVLEQIAADHDNDPDGFPYRIGPGNLSHQETFDFPDLDTRPTKRDVAG
ncbi:helix-turn-helix domain-containing protein [Streptomyces sp. NPDC058525]|uniref:helix-turn-helix domain-containing protein n=1 Tax=Streptomyces sp. NPDC058525 TaxID=3346538 RepID=UPI00366A1936